MKWIAPIVGPVPVITDAIAARLVNFFFSLSES
jgi:hypothetical protein